MNQYEMLRRNPCTPDCPRRKGGCAVGCPERAAFVAERQVEYESRAKRAQALYGGVSTEGGKSIAKRSERAARRKLYGGRYDK